MKIGICSDSHDNLAYLSRAMRAFRERGAEAVIHAGDFVAPFTIDELKLAGCPIYAVYGNCDGERAGLAKRFEEIPGAEIQTEPHIYELQGVRVALMHHPNWVSAFARQELADLVVHGHTHELRVEGGPPWIINPGEVFGQRSMEGPTVVWYDSDVGQPEVIYLDQRG